MYLSFFEIQFCSVFLFLFFSPLPNRESCFYPVSYLQPRTDKASSQSAKDKRHYRPYNKQTNSALLKS